MADNTSFRITPWRRGDKLERDKLNQPGKAINRILLDIAGPRQKESAGRVPPPQIRLMKIQSIDDDFLICRTWNGTTLGPTDIKVAKPYMLRKTPFDGETRAGITYTYTSVGTRTADDQTETEDQVIVPSYLANDEIIAILGTKGGTNTTDGEEDPKKINWLDLNVDARAWAKEAE